MGGQSRPIALVEKVNLHGAILVIHCKTPWRQQQGPFKSIGGRKAGTAQSHALKSPLRGFIRAFTGEACRSFLSVVTLGNIRPHYF